MILHPTPRTSDLAPYTRLYDSPSYAPNLRPCTLYPSLWFYTLRSEPQTLHPIPVSMILHPTPRTADPAPYTRLYDSTPYASNRRPCTLHPSLWFSILRPEPQTLHPTSVSMILHPTPRTAAPLPYIRPYDSAPYASNLRPCTLHPSLWFCTLRLEPQTLHPTSVFMILHPTPRTSDPAPYICVYDSAPYASNLRPAPYIRLYNYVPYASNLRPCTIYPSLWLCTLRLEPQTLHPIPAAAQWRRCRCGACHRPCPGSCEQPPRTPESMGRGTVRGQGGYTMRKQSETVVSGWLVWSG